VTGVTVDNQSTATGADHAASSSVLSLPELIQQVPTLVADIQTFSEAREWSKFHLPRNIILALLGEVGELAELLQWKGDDDDTMQLQPQELDKLSQELADVSIYLLRLASVVHVTDALVENLELVAN
jgi:dCTP diphosphatase